MCDHRGLCAGRDIRHKSYELLQAPIAHRGFQCLILFQDGPIGLCISPVHPQSAAVLVE